jgi:hypothetical protein
MAMSRPRIKFAQLRQLLLGLGFREVALSESAIGFQHDHSDTLIVLPTYRSNRIVLPHHLATVRMTLDAKGLMDSDDFDDAVASAGARKSAS